MSEFVHLHLHSHYSLLDGAIDPGKLVEKVASMKMRAVAVTDHGGMMGTIEFYEKARKAGVKPIIGTEIYVAPGSRFDRKTDGNGEKAYHLILLAENNEGYRNLLQLVSKAHVEGFYYKPRVDKEILREHSGGLIASSACLQGEIPFALMDEDAGRAAALLDEYRDIFPDGRFFLEIQDNGLPAQARANERLIALARKTDTPLIATNDAHYLNREDARFHEILVCLQTGKTLGNPDRMRFETDQFYVKSADEFERAFGHAAPDALRNTLMIAERCNVTLELGTNKLPEFPVPDGKTPETFLREQAEAGLAKRLDEKRRRFPAAPIRDDVHRERLAFELSVIQRMGFSGYFLIVWDFIGFAKKSGIPTGPGRGSAAGSLVAYCLGITEIDPLDYGLLFERFLNPERISLPDIDSDFCQERRDEVIRYVEDRFGKDHVAQIITFGTMKARAAVRDVGRVLEFPYTRVDAIAKLIPPDPKMTLESALKIEPRLTEMIREDPKVGELFEFAKAIEGKPRHASTHAAGVVIANRPITDYVPLYRNTNEEITTQFPMGDTEKVGLVKFDFLGLKTLTAIHNALRLIRETRRVELDVNELPLDDGPTYKMLGEGDTAGVFQCESGGFTNLLDELKPDRFTHMIDAVALYRPGPLQSGMVKDYIAVRHGRKKPDYLLPELEGILRDTYGVIVYQEQVMQIAVAIGGFTMGQADVLRKAMGKKKADLMDQQKALFLSGAKAKGFAEKKVVALFDLMAQFGEYGFNKSHSAAYGFVAYQTAYLKAHYPVEYFCALMTSESGDTAKIIRYINHCREKSIPILPPDVNESRAAFHPSGNAIRIGLSAIKGVGESAIDAVLEGRREKPFSSVADFLSRVDLRKVNKRVVECLVKAGAFDSLDPDRGRIMERLPELLEEAQGEARRRESGQFALFAGGREPELRRRERQAAQPEPLWTRRDRLSAERETLGFYITGHPLEAFKAEIALFANATTATVSGVKPGTEIKIGGVAGAVKEKVTKKGDKMAILTLEDTEGFVEVLVFPKTYAECRDALASEEPIFVLGRVESDESSSPGKEEAVRTKVIAEEVFRMENVRERLARSVHFQIQADRTTPSDLLDLRKAIERHRGEKKGFLHLLREGEFEAVIALPDRYAVSPTLELARELRGRFGYDVLRLHC